MIPPPTERPEQSSYDTGQTMSLLLKLPQQLPTGPSSNPSTQLPCPACSQSLSHPGISATRDTFAIRPYDMLFFCLEHSSYTLKSNLFLWFISALFSGLCSITSRSLPRLPSLFPKGGPGVLSLCSKMSQVCHVQHGSHCCM